MDLITRLEAKLRTLWLGSYNEEKEKHDAAELGLSRLYVQTHETVNGRRVKLTDRRKIAKAKELLDRIFSDDPDISQDAINQIKAMDA